ncbi:MAG: FAD-dependent oxidoreductase [Desulfococcaceae bacterium]
MRHVIIGNGVAGIAAAETLRRFDPDGAITLIADEAFPPYCRPMISMVLEGAIPAERLPIRGRDFYHRLGIVPLLGQRVQLFAEGPADAAGAVFAVEPDPEKAAIYIRRHIEAKRKALGLPAERVNG